ncbi:MAG TPA: helix-turn-helix domain-containing protein [Segetibacter sp.]|jgi:predicted DNA-binding transcriptional regulator AlpA
MKQINKSKKNKKENSEQEFLTVPENAARYRTTPPVMYRWIVENRFPENALLRIGRKILFHRKNLEAFESQGGELFKKAD